MKYVFSLIFFTLLLTFDFGFSQDLNHEIGVSIGAVSIQSDYGQRGDFASSYGNVGFGIGVNYFVSFDEYRRSWNERSTFLKNHFRLKLEMSYLKDNFRHYGKYIESLSATSIKMAAMRGSTKIYNLGGQLEYLIFDIMEDHKLEPYLAMGIYTVFYDPELESALGDWKDNPSLIPRVYQNGSIHLQKAQTQSFSFGFGTRYRVKRNFSMLADFRWQKFLTNNIDGLDPQIGANKYRDWLLYFQVGAAFKLN